MVLTIGLPREIPVMSEIVTANTPLFGCIQVTSLSGGCGTLLFVPLLSFRLCNYHIDSLAHVPPRHICFGGCALRCDRSLQNPFYLIVCDCHLVIENKYLPAHRR